VGALVVAGVDSHAVTAQRQITASVAPSHAPQNQKQRGTLHLQPQH
jgi:hypothetical protein